MSADHELRPLFLIDDEPIRSCTGDKLNQRRYARLVAETALGSSGPFTVGVYGGWGQGKTSLLKHAKDLLDQRTESEAKERLYPQVVTVFFNAWRYEREAHPIVPLVATIAQAVQRRLNEDVALPQQAGKAIRHWWGKVVDAGKSVVAATKGEAVGSFGNPVTGQVQGKVTIDGGAMQKNYEESQAARQAEGLLATNPWIKQSLYLSAFDDLESLWDEEVIKVATPSSPSPRVVVFVDDLDRCQPEKAFELLEGIKLALSQPGFIFVLALNAEIINRYLSIEARKRFGDDHARLGERYLDKIVQLEVPLRSHKGQFAEFIEKTVIETIGAAIGDATGKPPKQFADAVLTLRDLLGRFTDHTPRSLIRRLNSLIVDERLLPADAPFEARKNGESEAQHAARRRGYYMGLLLVQRTLVEMPGVGVAAVRTLHDDNRLCQRLNAEGLERLYDAFKPREKDDDRPEAGESVARLFGLDSKSGRKLVAKWLKLISPFCEREEASEIWQTEPGKAWLTDHAARTAVVELVVLRPVAAGASGARDGAENIGSEGGIVGGGEENGGVETLARQVAIIDREIRKKLKLKDGASVIPQIRGGVKELNLFAEPISNTGAAWLARPETGLKALTVLNLGGTPVTDAGVKELARAETGLKALTSLDLGATRVTDAGLMELARADSGLKALTSLSLGETQVTDAGVKELAGAEMGLKALTSLELWNTQVTDAGVRELARPETGLKALTVLNLGGTPVTDAGVKELARAETGLKALTSLDLGATRVTDAGLMELARADSGLKALTSLYLSSTQVTDRGMMELARAETGLKALGLLKLGNTQVTNAGVKAVLARFPDIKVTR